MEHLNRHVTVEARLVGFVNLLRTATRHERNDLESTQGEFCRLVHDTDLVFRLTIDYGIFICCGA